MLPIRVNGKSRPAYPSISVWESYCIRTKRSEQVPLHPCDQILEYGSYFWHIMLINFALTACDLKVAYPVCGFLYKDPSIFSFAVLHIFFILIFYSTKINMLPILLLSLIPAFVQAARPQTASLPRSLHPRDLFSRQSQSCNNGYYCFSSQTCCGIDCCDSTETCSYFTCVPTSSIYVRHPVFHPPCSLNFCVGLTQGA
jgi:hypothetical protein